MTIKSSQTLVSEALREIETISPEKALELSNDKSELPNQSHATDKSNN